MKKIEISNPSKVVIIPRPPVSGTQKPTTETKSEEAPAEKPEEPEEKPGMNDSAEASEEKLTR